MRKILLLTLNEQKEKVIKKVISTITDYIQIEPMLITPIFVLSFSRLERSQQQLQVFQNGKKVSFICFEYSTLVLLDSNSSIIFTQTQIFETSLEHR